MATNRELIAEMDGLEDEARAILADSSLTPVRRWRAFEDLLRKYRMLEKHKAALAAFCRRMRDYQKQETPDPNELVREIVSSPEFAALRLIIMAMYVAAIYRDSPLSDWVPVLLLSPSPCAGPLPGLRVDAVMPPPTFLT